MGERLVSHYRLARDGARETATPSDGKVVAADVAAL
jgi:hypothetical protein